MNYIILSYSVFEQLKAEYVLDCNRLNYDSAFDTYVQDFFTLNGALCLFNRCWNNTTFAILGNKCSILYLELHKQYENCFYSKKLSFLERNEEYLAQSILLPGKWIFLNTAEAHSIKNCVADDISETLHLLKGSYRELREFENQWNTWDLYNQKLAEITDRKEMESASEVIRASLENNVFTIYIKDWNKQYEEEAFVCVKWSGMEKISPIGKICGVNPKKNSIQVLSEQYSLISEYIEGKIGKMLSVRISDAGMKARLRRQKIALQKLFHDETANINLKTILMGQYEYRQQAVKQLTVENAEEYIRHFGENVGQAEAFLGAVNAPDIFLIQGPPGTGKTTIIVELVKYAVREGKSVLVSSETNTAVDNVLELIQGVGEILAVRLGREEAMTNFSKEYLPQNRARSLVMQVRKKQIEYEALDHDTEKLVGNILKQWNESMEQIDKEIQRHRDSLKVDIYTVELEKRIEAFAPLFQEVKSTYHSYKESEQQYSKLQQAYRTLSEKKAICDSEICVNTSDLFYTGIEQIEKKKSAQLESKRKLSEDLHTQILQIEQQLSYNDFSKKKRQYERNLRRLNREKEYLQLHIQEVQDFAEFMFQARQEIEKIRYLEQRKNRRMEDREIVLQKVKRDAEYKFALLDKTKAIRANWQSKIEENDTKQELQRIYMSRANVICATCSGIASESNGEFATREYDYVIIDEAAKCNTLDVLIPMTRGKKIILVGDHKQLYPMLETEQMENELSEEQIDELKKSILFRWLYEERVPAAYKKMLNIQYRMEKDIATFISERFYDGKLQSAKKKQEGNISMIWIDCEDSQEQIEQGETSYKNEVEARLIIRLLTKLNKICKKNASIGVISTYKKQSAYIEELLKKEPMDTIAVENSTVDAFQGKEKNIIIFDLVRSKNISEFLKDENRINVAISRAQEKVFVVGCVDLFRRKRAGAIHDLYEYIKLHGEVKTSRYIDNL